MTDPLAEKLADAIDLHQQGNLEEAAVRYLAILEVEPMHAVALHYLGTLALQTGNAAAARPLLELSLMIRSNNPEALDHLGLTLRALRRLEEAAATLRKAVALQPDNASAWSNLGLTLVELGDFEDAERACRTAIALEPGHLPARHNLAVALGEQGRVAAALTLLEDVIAEEPAMAPAWIDRARLHGAAMDAGEALNLEAWLQHPALPPAERQAIHFLLGHFEDRRDQVARAFEHFAAGNALTVSRFGAFDREAMRSRQWQLLGLDRAFFERHPHPPGAAGATPIFIVGMPRSGTTVVERMLAAHPEVGGGGELRALHDLATAALGETDAPLAERTFDAAWRQEQARRYLDQHPAAGAAWVTDKLPGLIEHLWLIALLFPNARILRCVRDPVDTCMSCFARDFAEGHTWSCDLSSLAAWHRHIQVLAGHWRQVLPLPILEIRYDELVEMPSVIGPRIFEHCALRWDERYLDLAETARLLRPLETERRTQRSIDTRSIGRWRRYEPFIGSLLNELQE